MSYCPEPDSQVRDKVMLLKKFNDATSVDKSNLAAKRDFIALKAEVDYLDINKLVNAPTSLNNLKTKVDDLDVPKLETVPVDLKKLSGAVSKLNVNNTKFKKLNTKVYSLANKIPNATTLVHINQ